MDTPPGSAEATASGFFRLPWRTTALCLVGFAVLTAAVGWRWEWVMDVDSSVADDLHEVVDASPGSVDALKAVTFLGTSLVLYSVVAVAAVASLARRQRRLAAFLVVTSVTGGLLNRLVKALVGRDRPSFPDPVVDSGGYSFPSGHAMNSAVAFVAVAVAVVVLTRRGQRWVVLVVGGLVLAIGFTRVALGVHFVSDVMGGWLLGLTWVVAGLAAFGLARLPSRAPAPP